MTRSRRSNFFIILILGALSTVSPFSIDMYLPAFPEIARDLGTTEAQISLSISGYFIGLALGQLFYGPLLDRYGRKPPLFAGLGLFVAASLACLLCHNPTLFIVFRIVQALGGCVAQAGALSMVRDFFPAKESAKIISLLFLVISVSPLFAPSIGGLIATTIGWRWVFLVLAGFALFVMAIIAAYLPEGHQPDKTISLRPAAIFGHFRTILRVRQFSVFAFAGAFSFAGLFVYVAGSPIIFIDMFHVGARIYGLIFAVLACGFIGGSQVNIWLSQRHEDKAVFRTAILCQNGVALVLILGVLMGWWGLYATLFLLFIYLPCCGIAYPNAAALALRPFTKNVGSASALLGFLQMGIGALASTGVGLFNARTSVPVFLVMGLARSLGWQSWFLRPRPRPGMGRARFKGRALNLKSHKNSFFWDEKDPWSRARALGLGSRYRLSGRD